MRKKGELIAEYEAQIDALYRGLERKDAKIKILELRIEVLREELHDTALKIEELTLNTIKSLTEGAESQ